MNPAAPKPAIKAKAAAAPAAQHPYERPARQQQAAAAEHRGQSWPVTGLRLHPEVKRALALFAVETGQTRSAVAEAAIREYLAHQQPG